MNPSQLSKFFSPLVRAWLWNWRKYLAPPRVEDVKYSGNFHLFRNGEVSRDEAETLALFSIFVGVSMSRQACR